MTDLIARAADFAREAFTGDSSGHDWWHTFRVWQLAARLAEAEGADSRTVQLAALLHDVDDAKRSPETAAGKLRARRFLEAEGVPEADVARILHIIGQVSYRGEDSETPDTAEGMCVQDADRLDAIGAVGIARTFAYGGGHGRPPEESIAHFHEKLLLLKDLMNTEKAKEMAESRHAFMEQFLKEWEQEIG